jgi:hypothetical protein
LKAAEAEETAAAAAAAAAAVGTRHNNMGLQRMMLHQ